MFIVRKNYPFTLHLLWYQGIVIKMLRFIALVGFLGLYSATSRIVGPTGNKYIQLLPKYYSPEFNESNVKLISTGICELESHVIRFVVDPANITTTAQHILHNLNTNCLSAPVQVMYESMFRIRSEQFYQFQLCVFVFVLADVHQFRSHLFNRRLEGKGLQRYFFVIEGIVEPSRSGVDRSWLRQIMTELWQKRILNVVVIFSEGDDELQWFTYTPFLDEGKRVELLAMNATSDWFYNKLLNLGLSQMVISMHNDEVDVRAQPKDDFRTEGYTGVDGMVANLIRERY